MLLLHIGQVIALLWLHKNPPENQQQHKSVAHLAYAPLMLHMPWCTLMLHVPWCTFDFACTLMHLASLETSRHVKIGALFFNLKRIKEKKNIEVQVPEHRGHQRTHIKTKALQHHIYLLDLCLFQSSILANFPSTAYSAPITSPHKFSKQHQKEAFFSAEEETVSGFRDSTLRLNWWVLEYKCLTALRLRWPAWTIQKQNQNWRLQELDALLQQYPTKNTNKERIPNSQIQFEG